jgi:hypothetical protein
MKKLAVIRGKEVPCPYGLKIDSACKDVGSAIHQMNALVNVDNKEMKQELAKRNQTTYLTYKEGQQCPFADNIIDKVNKVNCSYGDTAAGEKQPFIPASPLYPSIYVGHGNDVGIYDPRGYYFAPENVIDVPFGLFSIFSNRSNEQQFLKIAGKYTNNSTNMVDRLNLLRDKYYNTLASLMGNMPIKKLDEKDLEHLFKIISEWN